VDSTETSTGWVHTYKFTVRSNYVPLTGSDTVMDAFEATLAWIEPEVSPGASRIVLHDLDLVASLDSQGLPIKKIYPNNL